jgi:hypothetical protein
MANKPSPERSAAHYLIEAIDELVEWVKAHYLEVKPELNEDEWNELAELEGRVVGLLAAVGRIPFQSQPNIRSSHQWMLYTAGTGLSYFFCGKGRSLDCDDQWEPKMRALRAAVQVSAVSSSKAPQEKTKPGPRSKNNSLLAFEEQLKKRNPHMTDADILEEFGKKFPNHPIFKTGDPKGALRAARSRKNKKKRANDEL